MVEEMLKGKKTYIIAGIAGIATIAYALGYIELTMLVKIDAILAPFGLAFLRAGINNTAASDPLDILDDEEDED
tara:strand:+ start:257 stop:478 length:222 start_codon:yes stop_codon:yes gene_type:complete